MPIITIVRKMFRFQELPYFKAKKTFEREIEREGRIPWECEYKLRIFGASQLHSPG